MRVVLLKLAGSARSYQRASSLRTVASLSLLKRKILFFHATALAVSTFDVTAIGFLFSISAACFCFMESSWGPADTYTVPCNTVTFVDVSDSWASILK